VFPFLLSYQISSFGSEEIQDSRSIHLSHS
jgi:hypothetical protein